MKVPWKLTFTLEGVKISKMVESPLNRALKEVPIEENVSYEILNGPLRMVVETINAKREEGVLKELILGVSEFNIGKIREKNVEVTRDIGTERILIFGDEPPKPWRAFNQILIYVVEYLVNNGRIQEGDLPIYVPHGRQYLLNKENKNFNGREFNNPTRISDKLVLNKNFPREYCKSHAEYLMRAFDPDTKFEVRGFK